MASSLRTRAVARGYGKPIIPQSAVDKAIELFILGLPYRQIARATGMSSSNVFRIARGEARNGWSGHGMFTCSKCGWTRACKCKGHDKSAAGICVLCNAMGGSKTRRD